MEIIRRISPALFLYTNRTQVPVVVEFSANVTLNANKCCSHPAQLLHMVPACSRGSDIKRRGDRKTNLSKSAFNNSVAELRLQIREPSKAPRGVSWTCRRASFFCPPETNCITSISPTQLMHFQRSNVVHLHQSISKALNTKNNHREWFTMKPFMIN